MNFYKFIYILALSFSFTILANEQDKNTEYLAHIYGNSGHIGVEFSIGANMFEYTQIRERAYNKFIFLNDVNRFNLNTAITYFSTDFNRLNFLIEANLDIGTDYFYYNSFSFGVIDVVYLNKDWSINTGIITVFEGSYNFLLNLGVSYNIVKTKQYCLSLNDSLDFSLNSVGVAYTLNIKWMYIF